MGPLTLLPLLGIALGVSRVARVSLPAGLFLAVAFVVLALYGGALAGALWWTALAVHMGGVALLGLEALRRAGERTAFALPVPIGLLALLSAWFWLVHGEDQYFLYDEYSHWGIFLKEMLALDGFWTADTNSIHPRYPPGAALWQYLFNAFSLPTEGKAYFAQFVLLVTPLLLLWDKVRWSQPAWIAAILALVLLAIANFGLGVSTVYVDPIVAVWFLGTLLAAFMDENLASRRVALYAAPLAAVALFKDVGLALASGGALIIAALAYRRMVSSGLPRFALRKAAKALAVLLVPMLLCVQLWSWNRDLVGAAADVQSVDGFVGGLADQVGNADSQRKAEISRRLAEVFFDQQLSNGPISWEHNEFGYDMRELFTDSYRLTTFGLLVGFVLWWLAIGYGVLVGEPRRHWAIVASGVLATALVYLVGLHFSYRFTFGARGLDLPSYVRYVNVIALPMFLLAFCPLLPAFRNGGHDRAWRLGGRPVPRRAAIVAAALIASYGLETPHLRPILEPNLRIAMRADLEPLLGSIRGGVGRSRLWMYIPREEEENDFFGRMVQYLLAPTPAAVEDSKVFLENEDASRIAAQWRRFDYVWIMELPSVEAGIGLARFSGGVASPGLYRVRSSTDGRVTLELLGERDGADESAALYDRSL